MFPVCRVWRNVCRFSHEIKYFTNRRGGESVTDGHIATPIILGQRHSEVGWPVPFFAVFRFPVIA